MVDFTLTFLWNRTRNGDFLVSIFLIISLPLLLFDGIDDDDFTVFL